METAINTIKQNGYEVISTSQYAKDGYAVNFSANGKKFHLTVSDNVYTVYRIADINEFGDVQLCVNSKSFKSINMVIKFVSR